VTHQHVERARAAVLLKKYEVARREALLALAAEPDNPMAHQLLGEAAMRLGDFKVGKEQAAEVLRLAPNWGWGYWLLGCCWLLDDKAFPGLLGKAARLPKAAAAAEQALERDPCEPTFYALAAGIAINQGHTSTAFSLIERGLSIAPQFAALHQLRGTAHRADCDSDRAIECFEKSLGLAPENAECHRDLANVLFEQGQFQPAHEHIQEAMRLDPTDAFARDLLLKISQTRHALMRAVIWLNQILHYIRVLFPVWVVATVILGLPLMIWIDAQNSPLWLKNGFFVIWLAIVALPLESLAFPTITTSLWFLFGRDTRRLGLSWQQSWERSAPSLFALAIVPVIALSIWLQTRVLFDYFLTALAVSALQSCGAAFSSVLWRRPIYAMALSYALAAPCLLIHRLILADLFLAVDLIPFNALIIAAALFVRLLRKA
jgi:tetratricopeptide (TPR) repeat protein